MRADGRALCGESGASSVGGALSVRYDWIGNHIFYRLSAGMRILPEFRNCSRKRGKENFRKTIGRDHNINLVTATHFVPQIAEALSLAKQNGLQIPIVYNTSSYEHVSTLRLLEGLVDIYLPDLKYRNEEWSLRYSHAADYFFYASKAIAEMVRQVGKPVFSEEDGLMKRGVIVRHLALPGKEEDSKEVIRYLYETYGEQIYISIMNQFTPMPGLREYPELNRVLTEQEYSRIVDYAIRLGVEQGYIQEGETAKESFIPSFDCEGV